MDKAVELLTLRQIEAMQIDLWHLIILECLMMDGPTLFLLEEDGVMKVIKMHLFMIQILQYQLQLQYERPYNH